MSDKIPQAKLEDILAASAADVPHLTPAQLKKTKVLRKSLAKLPKQEPNHESTIKYLESLKREIEQPRRRAKTRNILERTPKEIIESATFWLSAAFAQETGYNAKWVCAALEEHWHAGRGDIKHNYEKRIRCCQLIHFLRKQGISELQAIALTDRIYDFNKTDAKDTYYYFKRDLKKYYFPEIRIKSHIPIRIILDALNYGRLNLIRVANKKGNEATIKLENIIQDAIELLKKEIQLAQREKLDKQGIQIHRVLSEILDKEYKFPAEFLLEIKKDDRIRGAFIFYTRQFLNDLEWLAEN